MAYTVYLRTNKINGKQYVGQSGDFETREKCWNAPSQRYSNKLINADRFKYGLDNWTSERLAEVDTQEEAWELEQKYIKDFNTKYPNGYNFGSGGYSNKDVYVSEETKKRMSDRMKELLKDPTNHPMYGRKGKDNPLYGIKRSEETKRKISEANKGKKMSEESIRKMAQKLKELHIIPPTAFEKGHTPWNKGKKMPEELVKKMTKQLYQYTLDDKFVKLWNSVKEAKEAGFHHADAVARGERPQNKGYKFYYEPL